MKRGAQNQRHFNLQMSPFHRVNQRLITTDCQAAKIYWRNQGAKGSVTSSTSRSTLFPKKKKNREVLRLYQKSARAGRILVQLYHSELRHMCVFTLYVELDFRPFSDAAGRLQIFSDPLPLSLSLCEKNGIREDQGHESHRRDGR